jgi:ZIP family zinc transporter
MDTLVILFLLIAGPVLGSLIGVSRRPSDLFISCFLSFAAGIMLAISFIQLIPASIKSGSLWLCCAGITAGTLLMYCLDKLIPHTDPVPADMEVKQAVPIRRIALFLLVGIGLHHFPEGMAIALGTVTGYTMSLSIALAIAVHDIPEAICTSAPYYYVTGKRLKSFLVSSSTAIPTIAGYFFAQYLFSNIPLQVVSFVVAATAGLMIYISADELIPASCGKDPSAHAHVHGPILFLVAGILFVIMLKAFSG